MRATKSPEVIQQDVDLSRLAEQELGVLGAGSDDFPEGRSGFVILIERGMPDEFKEILTHAVPDGIVRFVEVDEPNPQDEEALSLDKSYIDDQLIEPAPFNT